MLGLKRGTVKLYDHEKEWESEAQDTIERLKKILGESANDIQHIGSTAVPAIKAKPIIDIAVAADSFDDILARKEQLEKSGFYYRPNAQASLRGQLLFACGSYYDGTGDMQTHFIHVVKTNSMDWINYINFRDYLRSTPQAAKDYENLKMSLAKQAPEDSGREKYLQGKHDFIVYTLRKALVKSYLGKTVTIKIDRPIGYVHKKKDYTLKYPVNYGYIPGILGGDGEELDVYLLGVDMAVSEYTGKIIGIIHRHNDIEDKLVMAPDGIIFTQNEIAEQVHFQERYYKIEIEAIYQKSCGAVVYKKENEKIKILCILQRQSKTYSVPKGHMEAFETEEETAKQEIFEEIGIKAELLPGFRETVSYNVADGKHKDVVLFLAECTEKLKTDSGEIIGYKWLSPEAAKAILPEWYGPVIDKTANRLCVK